MRTFGFATRNVTDNIIRPFVVKCPNGVWHEKVQQVEPLLKTKWLSFGMKEREEWYRDKNDILLILTYNQSRKKEIQSRIICN